MTIAKRVICATLLLSLAAGLGLAAEGDPEKKSAWSTVDLQFYGFIKVDAAYDTSHANPGNFVRWIDLEPGNENDEQFNLTANQTRLGLWLTSPDDPDKSLLTKGRVEIDFYGGGAENKPNPMLRLAYIDLHWRKSGWRFIAGQTFDVISPLFPVTINYSVQWWAGNIGYRRPQLQLGRRIEPVGFHKMQSRRLRSLATSAPPTVSSPAVDVGHRCRSAGIPGSPRLGAGTAARPVRWRSASRAIGPKRSSSSTKTAIPTASTAGRPTSISRYPLSKKATLKAEAYTGHQPVRVSGGYRPRGQPGPQSGDRRHRWLDQRRSRSLPLPHAPHRSDGHRRQGRRHRDRRPVLQQLDLLEWRLLLDATDPIRPRAVLLEHRVQAGRPAATSRPTTSACNSRSCTASRTRLITSKLKDIAGEP